MYLGRDNFFVKDYIDIPKCHKCQGYGHVRKHCEGKEMCGKCGEEHDTRSCRSGGDASCGNCRREQRDDGHPVGWWGCPTYKRALMKYFGMVNYGV